MIFNQQISISFPRVRGDVPHLSKRDVFIAPFSPRARGCSLVDDPKLIRYVVFPACAGMFRFPSTQILKKNCFPRVRGDVPTLL